MVELLLFHLPSDNIAWVAKLCLIQYPEYSQYPRTKCDQYVQYSQYRTLKFFKYREYPQYRTPKCFVSESIRSTEPRNAASTRDIPRK